MEDAFSKKLEIGDRVHVARKFSWGTVIDYGTVVAHKIKDGKDAYLIDWDKSPHGYGFGYDGKTKKTWHSCCCVAKVG